MDMAREPVIRSVRFRQEREKDWRRLDELVTRAEKSGVHSLGWAEAQSLSRLYRQASNSLSVAREISLDKSLLTYLEALVARAYLTVYAPQVTVSGLVGRFFREGAPRAIRDCSVHIALGFLCMFLGAALGYGLYFQDSSWYNVFVPAQFGDARGPGASTETLRQIIYEEHSWSGLGSFASFLFSHNTRIAIFAFGLGAFACFPAMTLTLYNGTLLGAFVALHVDRGLGWDIGGWLSIHGVTEISAICIACGAGLKLGSAVLFPGDRTRKTALRLAGRSAVQVALVAAIMLVAAALLEGFGRQMVRSMELRYIIGWGVGLLWLTWFIYGGRRAAYR